MGRGRWVRLRGNGASRAKVVIHHSDLLISSCNSRIVSWSKFRRFFLGVGCLGVGSLGVGCWALGRAAGSPPGRLGIWALDRSPAAGFAPPWLVHPLSTPPPPPTPSPTPPRRRRRQNRADERAEPPPTFKTPVRRQRGLDSAYILTTAERKEIFWALGV